MFPAACPSDGTGSAALCPLLDPSWIWAFWDEDLGVLKIDDPWMGEDDARLALPLAARLLAVAVSLAKRFATLSVTALGSIVRNWRSLNGM